MELVGRDIEQKIFKKIYHDNKAAFVAVYGRRRVGKTFLIKQYFNHQFTFYTTGLSNSNTKAQLESFTAHLSEYFQKDFVTPNNWLQAFIILQKELTQIKGKKVIFIDELPWFDTKKSDFIAGLERFWNSWASAQKDIKLIVCGSSASWMINKLLKNKGGLHNRVTHRLKIEPFSLKETEQFFKRKKINLDKYQIAQIYMVMGGIPYYLEQANVGESAVQIINNACFNKEGLLKDEFKYIFSSLFRNAQKHEQILRIIYQLGSRATRENILKKLKIPSSGDFTLKINELEESGFIKSYLPFQGKVTKKIYVLADYYTMFYLKFIEPQKINSWIDSFSLPEVNTWAGLTFEQVCWDHTMQIKRILGIEGVEVKVSFWNKKASATSKGAQIDMVFERKDKVYNLFEIKFSNSKFEITKKYDLDLRNKRGIFIDNHAINKAVFTTMLTTFGVQRNMYYESSFQNEIKLDQLFS